MDPLQGIIQKPAAIACLRAAAGLWIPNHAFRDVNAAVYQVTDSDPPDGLAQWLGSKFRGWYYYGNVLGDPYGSYAGAKNPQGFFDAICCALTTSGSSTGQSISTDHRVLAQTAYTGFIPFQRFFKGHYDKPITLALVAEVPATMTIGTDLKAWIGCYGSDGLYDAAQELVFSNAGSVGDGVGKYMRLVATTVTGLASSTYWIQLHVGIKSPGGSVTVSLADCALMLNPTNAVRAIDSPTANQLWINLDTDQMGTGATMGWQGIGLSDRTMLDGRRQRLATVRDGIKHSFAAAWRKMPDYVYQKLMAIWYLNTQGLGPHVPEPLPVGIDTGLGQSPFFGYYNISGASFNGTFHRHWTFDGGGYDIALAFDEV